VSSYETFSQRRKSSQKGRTYIEYSFRHALVKGRDTLRGFGRKVQFVVYRYYSALYFRRQHQRVVTERKDARWKACGGSALWRTR
jgi:hypothetical protein